MKFTKRHTLNGVTYEAGDRFAGDVFLGRFLHQRGALEPDGAPEDAAITAKHTKPSWSAGTSEAPTEPQEPATPKRRAKRPAEQEQ